MTDTHHPRCPVDPCCCGPIAAAILDDLDCPHGDTWRLNLELIGQRHYARGYADGVASCG
mgnify:CR=1 FL=1